MKPTLYRACCAHTGVLLHVGITRDSIDVRKNGHRHSAHWFRENLKWEVETLRLRNPHDLRLHEDVAIYFERPKWNKTTPICIGAEYRWPVRRWKRRFLADLRALGDDTRSRRARRLRDIAKRIDIPYAPRDVFVCPDTGKRCHNNCGHGSRCLPRTPQALEAFLTGLASDVGRWSQETRNE